MPVIDSTIEAPCPHCLHIIRIHFGGSLLDKFDRVGHACWFCKKSYTELFKHGSYEELLLALANS